MKPANYVFGRPTKYDPSFVSKIEDYLLTVGREQTKLPKRVDIYKLLDIHHDTLEEWVKLYPDFSAAIKKIDDAQQGQLMDDGMYGGKEVNSAMAIFLLKANHGLIETGRLEVTGVHGQPINIITGRGYIPANTQVIEASVVGNAGEFGTVQSPRVAQESTQDDNSNIRADKTSSSS